MIGIMFIRGRVVRGSVQSKLLGQTYLQETQPLVLVIFVEWIEVHGIVCDRRFCLLAIVVTVPTLVVVVDIVWPQYRGVTVPLIRCVIIHIVVRSSSLQQAALYGYRSTTVGRGHLQWTLAGAAEVHLPTTV